MSNLRAVIDVGSNTVRMLVGSCDGSVFSTLSYHQQITRLGGDYSPASGLASASMARTLDALVSFAHLLENQSVADVRAVGTAALRRAVNAGQFLAQLKAQTGITLEIIDGREEARLTTSGVLFAMKPCPDEAIIVDIGGGSTEFIYICAGDIQFCKSYPVGVVRLCEENSCDQQRQQQVAQLLEQLSGDLHRSGLYEKQLEHSQLIGTAGTVTTLAAMNLKMSIYDRRRINNHQLDVAWLSKKLPQISSMSISQREQLTGVEVGRADLILPGLELLIALCGHFKRPSIWVTDAGLLEGLMLDFCHN